VEALGAMVLLVARGHGLRLRRRMRHPPCWYVRWTGGRTHDWDVWRL